MIEVSTEDTRPIKLQIHKSARLSPGNFVLPSSSKFVHLLHLDKRRESSVFTLLPVNVHILKKKIQSFIPFLEFAFQLLLV